MLLITSKLSAPKRDYTITLGKEGASAAMPIEYSSYGLLHTSFSNILLYVVNHGTYHRGNVTAILRQQSYAGVPIDYLLYLMERRQQLS
nr:DinB family protein [Paenibacillus sp. 1011MAR3C5]